MLHIWYHMGVAAVNARETNFPVNLVSHNVQFLLEWVSIVVSIGMDHEVGEIIQGRQWAPDGSSPRTDERETIVRCVGVLENV